MTGTIEPINDLDRLLSAMLDGTLSVEDESRLAELVTSDDAARADYLDLFEAHAILRWENRIAADRASAAVEPPMPAGRIAPAHRFTGRWQAIAAVVAIAGLAAAVYVAMSGGSNDATQHRAGRQVAVLTDASGVVWGSEPMAPGEQVYAGDLDIESGVVEMEMLGGATVWLTGPTRFEMTGPSTGRLSLGHAHVRLSDRSDFTVALPSGASIVVLGTEFIVTVDERGLARIAVLDGSVEVRGADGAARKLTRGAGATVDADGRSVDADASLAIMGDAVIGVWRAGGAGYGLGREATTFPVGATLTTVDGPFGPAASFDGVERGVVLPNRLPADFTIAMWVRSDTPSATGTMAFEGSALLWSDVPQAADDFSLSLLNDRVAFHDGAAARQIADVSVIGSTPITDGRWHQVTVTRQAGERVRIYVDGRLDGEGAAGDVPLTANPDIAVGFSLDPKVEVRRALRGQMDRIILLNRAITGEEVAELNRIHPQAAASERGEPEKR